MDVGGYLSYVVQRQAGVSGRFEVTRGHTGFEDQVSKSRRDAGSVVDDGEGPVAAAAQREGYEDTPGSRFEGIAKKLQKRFLHGGDAVRGAPDALRAAQSDEAGSKVPVGSLTVTGLLEGAVYRATSLTRLSRITVTLIWPGYSRSSSIFLEMSNASLAATRSSTSDG